ncbi:alpha/beta hydrolase family protein [Cognatishimia activa]|uniref:alpha/beta hydrolase family protein n=1 Tax=Cognatishimia activa TaxID=1715691 RepID=UPI002232A0C4|nr:dienelactone hydrolase family protein [Cognatishimia activa]UZD92284.1 dienelactone hydrolase family protein [Cognatishimia activa]
MTRQDRSAKLRDDLGQLLGPSFLQKGLMNPETIGIKEAFGWVLETLRFTAPDGEAVQAYFFRPPEGTAPVPAVIYAHAHGNRYAFGKDELFEGRPTLQGAYAKVLMTAGIAALCIEMPCFGDRQQPDESTRAKAKLWRGDTLFGQMLSEQRAGLDFLENHPAIDKSHLGAIGFSMGSTLTFWLAALDHRIRAAAALCSFADLDTLIQTGAHDGHGIYMSVPGLTQAASTGEIAGLTAPRALQICAGLKDWSTPSEALRIGLQDLEAAYRSQDALEHLYVHIDPDCDHAETPEMRADVLSFLKKELYG